MTLRWLTNALLLALVLVLASAIRHELARVETLPALSDLSASSLLRIDIVREGEPTVEFRQSPQGWRLIAPWSVDADPERVARLLAILKTPVQRSLPQAAVALDQLGLTSPKLRLRFDTLELAFGGSDPIAQCRYVASADLVHLVEDREYPLLIAAQPLDYVSRRLLPRGFIPVFGRIAGMPLAAEALAGLDAIGAERLELVTGDLVSDAPLELKATDGTTLRFLVSEDRRRWRLTLPSGAVRKMPDERAGATPALQYVLTTAPVLTTDPTAIDPTPPAPAPEIPAAIAPDAASMPGGAAPEIALPAADAAFSASDPDAILPGDAPSRPPPTVRLTPDGQAPVKRKRNLHSESVRSEPVQTINRQPTTDNRQPTTAIPSGFGEDPFAPDPLPDSDAAPVRGTP